MEKVCSQIYKHEHGKNLEAKAAILGNIQVLGVSKLILAYSCNCSNITYDQLIVNSERNNEKPFLPIP